MIGFLQFVKRLTWIGIGFLAGGLFRYWSRNDFQEMLFVVAASNLAVGFAAHFALWRLRPAAPPRVS